MNSNEIKKQIKDLSEIPLAQEVALAQFELSVNTEKIFYMSLANLDLSRNRCNGYVYLDDYCKYAGISRDSFRKIAKRAAKELKSGTISLELPDEGWDETDISYGSRYERGCVMIKYSPDLRENLVRLSQNVMKMPIESFLAMTDKVSLRLYKVMKLKNYIEDGVSIEYSYDAIRNICGIENYVNRDVNKAIKKAVSEINKKTELNITYRILKNGEDKRISTHIAFTIVHVSQIKSEKQTAMMDTRYTEKSENVRKIIGEKAYREPTKNLYKLYVEAEKAVEALPRPYSVTPYLYIAFCVDQVNKTPNINKYMPYLIACINKNRSKFISIFVTLSIEYDMDRLFNPLNRILVDSIGEVGTTLLELHDSLDDMGIMGFYENKLFER